jgi:hypothetical protein
VESAQHMQYMRKLSLKYLSRRGVHGNDRPDDPADSADLGGRERDTGEGGVRKGRGEEEE